MPLNDRDRKALKVGGIVAAVLVLALVGLGQLGKGGAPALPPLSVGPSTATGPVATGPGVTGPSESGSPSQGGPSPSPIFSGRDPFSLPPQFQTIAPPSGVTGPGPTGRPTGPGPTGSTGGPGPTGSTGGGPGPTGSTNPPTNGSTTVIGGHTVVLIDTFTPTASRTPRSRSTASSTTPPRVRRSREGTSSCETWRATAPRSCSATSPSRSASPRPSRRVRVPAVRPRGERSPARGRPRLGAAPAPSGHAPGPYDGRMLRMLTAGESHGKALVAILEGLPAGVGIVPKEIAGSSPDVGTGTDGADGSGSRRTGSRS